MRIFVAGATGAVGRPLVPALISAGHSVVGLTRTAAKAETIRRMGAEPVVADGLDAAAIRAAVVSARPEVIIDEMTDLADATDLRHFDRAFANSNRLRTLGTDHLLAAAREAGVKRFIAQSFCGWAFARNGGSVKTEADELDPDPPAGTSPNRCKRSGIWNRPSPVRRSPKASFCAMARSTDRAPGCSLPRWSSRYAIAACR